MSDVMTDTEFAVACEQMADAGRESGRAAASWLVDGNTTESTLRELLRMWEEGDPAAPLANSPFSGEWAGDPTVEDVIDCETDCDVSSLTPEEIDELATSFEEAYYAAWQEEAERSVRAMLPE